MPRFELVLRSPSKTNSCMVLFGGRMQASSRVPLVELIESSGNLQ